MKKILIIGANSKIALECSKIWASRNYELYLIGRNKKKLKINSRVLLKRGAKIAKYKCIDLLKIKKLRQEIEKNFTKIKNIDIAFICFGALFNQKQEMHDWNKINKNIYLNGIVTCQLIYLIFKIFCKKKIGSIVVITSVAGDVIKKSNFIYGLAKSMVSNFMLGLNYELKNNNIRLIDIKPGLIKTPMTVNFKKNFLWSKANSIAKIIAKKIEINNSEVIYVPFYWRYLIAILKVFPKKILKFL